MGNWGFKGVPVAVVLSVAVITGGCAAPPAAHQPTGGLTQAAPTSESTQAARSMLPGFVGTSEMSGLTRKAIDEFPESLPKGASWSNAPLHQWKDDDAAIEDGVPEVAIAEYWSCAWMGDYIGAVDADDQPRADHAMSQLEKYPSLPAILAHHQDPEIFTSSVLQPAKKGDTRLLREFFTTCRSLTVAADGKPTLTKMIPTSPASAG